MEIVAIIISTLALVVSGSTTMRQLEHAQPRSLVLIVEALGVDL
jgi:hypothetical protein